MSEEKRTYLEGAGRVTAAVAGGRSQVLPEEGVVDVSTTVEVEQGRGLGGLAGVAGGVGLGNGVEGRVEAADVGLVVLGVVQLHDLGRDVGLKGVVVVWEEQRKGQ